MNDDESLVRRAAVGLPELADWAAAYQVDLTQAIERMLLPLGTTRAVEEFAARCGLTVAYDEEGNASAERSFGPVVLHAYGYVDVEQHRGRSEERLARRYAERSGLALVPVSGGGRP